MRQLLDADAHIAFLSMLQESKSQYKTLAIHWFQAIAWTGIRAKTWHHVQFDAQQERYLHINNRPGPTKCFNLIFFEDSHVERLRHLSGFFPLLDQKGFDHIFHSCRQLYARSSNILWADNAFQIGFRTAADIFAYRVKLANKHNAAFLMHSSQMLKTKADILPPPARLLF